MCRPKCDGGLGFRDIELFNLALLARQAWRVLTDPMSLNARILKAVYFPRVSLLHAELGSRPSAIWRAICEGRDLTKLGIIRRIGNGKDTSFLGDNWIPRDFRLRPVCALSDHPPNWVSELIDAASCSWNHLMVYTHLLPMDAERVLNIP